MVPRKKTRRVADLILHWCTVGTFYRYYEVINCASSILGNLKMAGLRAKRTLHRASVI